MSDATHSPSRLSGRSARFARWLCAACLLGSIHAASSSQVIPLEGPRDLRWLRFELHLKEFQLHLGRQPLNILQLGDSHTAGNFLPRRLRQHFQAQYGSVGIGLLPPGLVKDHPALQAALQPSAQWITLRDRPSTKSRSGPHPLPGIGGFVAFGSSPYQSIGYALSRQTEPSRLYVYANGKADKIKLYDGTHEIKPRINENTGKRSGFDVPANTDHLTLLSTGGNEDFQLLGVNILPSTPQITFSSIGVNGASFDILREWDSDVTRMELKDLAPGLIILAFGTNDIVNTRFSAQGFAQTLRNTTDWLQRNAPEAAVLLLLPPRAPGLSAQARQNLELAHAAMRQAASSNEWRIWDWSQLSQESYSPLFQKDGIHLTPKGYELTADRLFDAISRSAEQK